MGDNCACFNPTLPASFTRTHSEIVRKSNEGISGTEPTGEIDRSAGHISYAFLFIYATCTCTIYSRRSARGSPADKLRHFTYVHLVGGASTSRSQPPWIFLRPLPHRCGKTREIFLSLSLWRYLFLHRCALGAIAYPRIFRLAGYSLSLS